jgi:hypothetical protein
VTPLGVPTSYSTVRLDADLKLHDVRADSAGGSTLAFHATGVETADGGQLLFIFDINSMNDSKIRVGPGKVSWDDIFAEALADWFVSARSGLAAAFPRRCIACKLDYEAGVDACERCGRALPALPHDPDSMPATSPDGGVATPGGRGSRGRPASQARPDLERLDPPR